MRPMKGENQKLKMLYLSKIFAEQTDDEHGLTMPEIIERLAACGVNADRKTLYLDFEELRRYGLDILSEQVGHKTYYSLGARDFELPELKLLVDSVQAAKFITDKKSRELIRKLEGMVSAHQARQLHRQVLISGRVKAMNESIYYNIDKLHGAINADAQIRFQYYQWNVKKEMALRRNGAWYQVSPWALIWDDENYYLVAYDGIDSKIKHYRVDKMLHIKITEEKRLGRDTFRAFDMAKYAKSLFGMYGGEETDVTLEGENHLVGVVIDRFGKDIALVPIDEERFEAKVRVAVSPQFFGWVMGLGGGVRVTGPGPVVKRMRAEVQKLADQYL
ncbi:MAG: WYL domain-containing protein [Clostridia bacterium]|nr:WYL domain-containing protein [Clostridia bacterium]